MKCFIAIAFQIRFKTLHLKIPVKEVQVKFTETCKFLVSADDINLLEKPSKEYKDKPVSYHSPSMENGLAVNADKTK
jgi:hypothetical protein